MKDTELDFSGIFPEIPKDYELKFTEKDISVLQGAANKGMKWVSRDKNLMTVDMIRFWSEEPAWLVPRQCYVGHGDTGMLSRAVLSSILPGMLVNIEEAIEKSLRRIAIENNCHNCAYKDKGSERCNRCFVAINTTDNNAQIGSPSNWQEVKEAVSVMCEKFPAGTRVELVYMDDVQAPPPGTKGTVIGVDDMASLIVSWDNGCGLNVAYGKDVVRKIGG